VELPDRSSLEMHRLSSTGQVLSHQHPMHRGSELFLHQVELPDRSSLEMHRLSSTGQVLSHQHPMHRGSELFLQ
jgi:hypothetical protein